MAGIVEAIREGEGEEDETRQEEGERVGNIRLDPFVQPPILKALFEQLSLEQLAKCRRVSKLWLDESLLTWRSKATLKFDKGGIVSKREDGSRRRPTTSLGEFLGLWNAGDWGSCPFKKFSIHSWKFIAGDVEEQERFMELVGGHVTSLTLHSCVFIGRDNFQRIIYQAFPKLQFLKMYGCMVDNINWYEPAVGLLVYKAPTFGVHGLKSLDISWCLPDSMMDMLSHFHKLESLRLDTRIVNRGDYRNLLETIILIRAQDQTKLPLTNFDANFEFDWERSTASIVEILKLQDRLKLPIRRFEIHFDHDGNMVCNEDVITETLQHHSSALKCLQFSGRGRHGLTNSFPFGIYLENLDELIIGSHRFFDSLNYLRNTPNLRVLKIYGDLSMAEADILFSNSAQLENGDWTLPALTDLSIRLPLSPCNLGKLMKWMPHVERLSGVKLDDIKFSLVCKNWKDIQHLEDKGIQLTDEGVIGKGNAHDGCGDEETHRGPNITDLKNLTSFKTWSSRLTSASVHEGFLKLANLKYVGLGGSTEFDDEAKAALAIRKIRLESPIKVSICSLE